MLEMDSPPERPRVAFWTLGCRLNQYETESLKATLASSAVAEVVGWEESADVYVLNSCTVTGKADQECRRLARQVKRRAPQSKVVVAGCYAQTQPEQLRVISEIDGIIGNTSKHDIARWLGELLQSREPLLRVEDFRGRESFPAGSIADFAGRARAFVKVQDGCDHRCSYCLIWRARGPCRSRPLPEIHAQLERLVAAGYREVVLAGVHLGAYGQDQGQSGGLVLLLEKTLAAFPELRLRLSSLHPDEIGPELRRLFASEANLRPHAHVSLQSGSDGVLRRMGRRYRRDAAARAIAELAATRRHFGLGADIIVGFPQETEREFAETCTLLETLPVTYLHVFRYSRRPGTPAALLPGQVPPELASERARLLRAVARRKNVDFRRSLLGVWQEAVAESDGPESGWRQATTANYTVVLVRRSWSPCSLLRLRPDRWRSGRLYADSVQRIDQQNHRGREVR